MTRSDPMDRLTVNVAALLGEPAGSFRDYVEDGLAVELGPDFALAGPVNARFRLSRTTRGLLVDGDAHAVLADSCSRCLRPVEVHLDVEFHEEALPSVELTTGAPVNAGTEPDVARLTDHHEIELEPFVREAIQLAAPIAPLCRPDCPGLCAVCGQELAGGPHEHAAEPIDPRLEALLGFQSVADPSVGSEPGNGGSGHAGPTDDARAENR